MEGEERVREGRQGERAALAPFRLWGKEGGRGMSLGLRVAHAQSEVAEGGREPERGMPQRLIGGPERWGSGGEGEEASPTAGRGAARK